MRIALLMVLAAAMVAGCTTSQNVLPEGEPFDISGIYRSTQEVGELGTIWLEIGIVFPSRTFRAWVSSAFEDGEFSPGVGTVGDNHLILNFDRGKTTDYYFEGTFETTGNLVTSIDGRFIFPDEKADLPVEFEPAEL